MKKITRWAGVLVAAAGFGILGAAQANPNGHPDILSPGGSNFLNNATSGLYEQFSFTGAFHVLATSTHTFTATPNVYSGSLFSEVIAGDTRNPLGGLDFVYQITVDQRGTSDGIHRMTIDDFAGVKTDVGFIQQASTLSQRRPTSADRSGFGDAGNVIGFNFLPNPTCGPVGCFGTPGTLARGRTSAILIIYTDATAFRTTTANFIDGGIAHAATFAPVPEPDTYAMMAAGFGLMAFVMRRRRKNTAA